MCWTWEDVVPCVGMKVTIDFEPGCSQETLCHGIQSMIQGRKGIIKYFGGERKGDDDHIYWIGLDWDGQPKTSWFTLTEMRPEGGECAEVEAPEET